MVPPSLFFFTNKKRRPLKCYLKTMVSWGGGGVLGRHRWPQQMTLDYHISKAEIRLRRILVRGQQFLIMGQTVSILGFVGHIVFIAPTQSYCCVEYK